MSTTCPLVSATRGPMGQAWAAENRPTRRSVPWVSSWTARGGASSNASRAINTAPCARADRRTSPPLGIGRSRRGWRSRYLRKRRRLDFSDATEPTPQKPLLRRVLLHDLAIEPLPRVGVALDGGHPVHLVRRRDRLRADDAVRDRAHRRLHHLGRWRGPVLHVRIEGQEIQRRRELVAAGLEP